jgi:hypothetical protein
MFLHHVGDVWGQPTWLLQAKKNHLWAIYEHVIIWAGLVSIGLYLFDNFEVWKFFFLAGGHFVIDWFFYQALPKIRNEEKQYWYVYPDQFLHYIQLVIVCVV